MLDFLFAQSTIIAIVIGGFLGIGFSLLLLHWRKKIIAFGPRSRKKAVIASAVVFIFLGLIIFFLMVITAFSFHSTLFHQWIIWFAVDLLITTIVFTCIGYIITSIMLKQIRFS